MGALSLDTSETCGGAGDSVRRPDELDEQIERLLHTARVHLDMDVAWVTQFIAGDQIVRVISGAADSLPVRPGSVVPLEHTFCVRVVSEVLPNAIPDARTHPLTRDLTITGAQAIGAYIGVPLREASGEPMGMLCCLAGTARPALNQDSVHFLELMAQLISGFVHGERIPRHLVSAPDEAAAVREIVRSQDLRMVFQPVVRLRDNHAVAFEALARFDGDLFASPAHAFAAAHRIGLGSELEQLAIDRAISDCHDLPEDSRLTVNVSAEALVQPRVQEAVLGRLSCGLTVELTEHTEIHDYDRVRDAIGRLRGAGVALAVDDAGAGFASLRHILQLRPDVIKLDIDITRDVDTDPYRHSLTRSLAGFARDIGAMLVAEGVQTPAEHRCLIELEVEYAQGFYYGRPEPAQAWRTGDLQLI
ncbi:EAL domain-containing protein [Jatrophihabitans telluris]|uniref:EAL domain-containing protein n=1 Tax=Jatrophihabitans telluris TaxID=2038343 RepID=A0ABY4R5M7_9ACTN|nr:EAL domain-containing protein [Jatrophihabitans telluris]UQX90246.1 EAL domain-containing protein [Jatrophihabitans telluris]